MTPTLIDTLSPLTLWKSDLSLPWTTLWKTLLIRPALVNKLVPWWRLAFEWHSRNSEITIITIYQSLLSHSLFRINSNQYCDKNLTHSTNSSKPHLLPSLHSPFT